MITGNHDWYTDARTERDFTHHPFNTQHPSSAREGRWWRMPGFWHKQAHAGATGVTVDMFYIDTQIWRIGSGADSAARRRIVDAALAGSFGGSAAAKDAQVAWLRRELAASQAVWKVVLGHHPIYTAGSHGTTPVLLAELDPILREFGVQFYIAGHDHNKQ
eukprot:gene22485-56430_t